MLTAAELRCETCGVLGSTERWTYMVRIDPATRERSIVWRCPACNYAKADDPRDERHKRAAKRGGFKTRMAQRGTTKAGA